MENQRVPMFGEELEEIRQRFRLTREQMAKRLGIASRTLERLEKDRDIITQTIENFANTLVELGEALAENEELKQKVQAPEPVEPLQPRPSQNHASEYWQRTLSKRKQDRRPRERDEGKIGTDFYDPETGETWRRKD